MTILDNLEKLFIRMINTQRGYMQTLLVFKKKQMITKMQYDRLYDSAKSQLDYWENELEKLKHDEKEQNREQPE